jgi:hypothetical protein
MRQRKNDMEENIKRLIRTAFTPDACPNSQIKTRVFTLLLDQMRKRPAMIMFPDSVVGILGLILISIAFYIASQIALAGTSFTAAPSLMIMAIWLLPNLLVLPAAGIVILLRRRHG